jgi:hypothetical protein
MRRALSPTVSLQARAAPQTGDRRVRPGCPAAAGLPEVHSSPLFAATTLAFLDTRQS